MLEKSRAKGDEGCVLFVDDEEPVRESLRELLTTCGFRVLLADSYKSAVGVLKGNEEIEAIICDIKMPDKPGLEVLRYVNKGKQNIPLIFLTGYGTLETSQEALRDGAFDYILKPIDNKDKIVLPLKHAVEKYRSEKKNREMQLDILRLAEEHERILGDLLSDVETREKAEERMSEIVDKWEDQHKR